MTAIIELYFYDHRPDIVIRYCCYNYMTLFYCSIGVGDSYIQDVASRYTVVGSISIAPLDIGAVYEIDATKRLEVLDEVGKHLYPQVGPQLPDGVEVHL